MKFAQISREVWGLGADPVSWGTAFSSLSSAPGSSIPVLQSTSPPTVAQLHPSLGDRIGSEAEEVEHPWDPGWQPSGDPTLIPYWRSVTSTCFPCCPWMKSVPQNSESEVRALTSLQHHAPCPVGWEGLGDTELVSANSTSAWITACTKAYPFKITVNIMSKM